MSAIEIVVVNEERLDWVGNQYQDQIEALGYRVELWEYEDETEDEWDFCYSVFSNYSTTFIHRELLMHDIPVFSVMIRKEVI